jgi:hypothetical protein
MYSKGAFTQSLIKLWGEFGNVPVHEYAVAAMQHGLKFAAF